MKRITLTTIVAGLALFLLAQGYQLIVETSSESFSDKASAGLIRRYYKRSDWRMALTFAALSVHVLFHLTKVHNK